MADPLEALVNDLAEALFDAAHEHCDNDGCTGGSLPYYLDFVRTALIPVIRERAAIVPLVEPTFPAYEGGVAYWCWPANAEPGDGRTVELGKSGDLWDDGIGFRALTPAEARDHAAALLSAAAWAERDTTRSA